MCRSIKRAIDHIQVLSVITEEVTEVRGISVVVCCYNSSLRLPRTLKHLADQKVRSNVNCEVIVVDNNSCDSTAHAAKAEWLRLGEPYPLTVVSEDNPGLSNARKKGIQTARYEYICFCDDDNWLCDTYLETAIVVMDSNPSIGVLAGQGVAVSDIVIPNWFYTYYRSFACGVLDLESGDVTKRQEVWGAGMVIRRSVYLDLRKAGFQHLSLDREGEKLTSGGDTEICYWHILVGYKLWYDERLVFEHYMPSSRLSKDYLRSLQAGGRESGGKLRIYPKMIKGATQRRSLTDIAKAIVRVVRDDRDSAEVFTHLPWLLRTKERRALLTLKGSIDNFKKVSLSTSSEGNVQTVT